MPSPWLTRPLEHSADLVVHSLTKYMGGHGTSIGGIIVDGGRFPWTEHKPRFRRLNEPEVSYHGVNHTEALGPAAYIGRARTVPLRDMGAATSQFNIFLILQGLETLGGAHGPPLRERDRDCPSSAAASQGRVGQLRGAAGPFEPRPDTTLLWRGAAHLRRQGRSRGRARFQDALKLITPLVNIGDARSLACHPASTTHRQLSPDELRRAGVSEDMVRLSIGVKRIDYNVDDLEQALLTV